MKIVLGLGNPGNQYLMTRHNAGMMVVDYLASKIQKIGDYGWRKHKNIMIYESQDLVLVKTADYFMNESGGVIRDFFKNSPYPLENFYLAHDDLDLKLGEYKIQFGKGPKVHNGVESVENAVRSRDFYRIRIGIDSRVTPVSGEEYVLQKFIKEERVILDGVLDKISHEITETNS